MLRKQFMLAFGRRFNNFRRKLHQLIAVEDALGLRQKSPFALNNRWAGMSDAQKIQEFTNWIKTEINTEMMASDDPDAWWSAYIRKGYLKGHERAYQDVNKYGFGKKPQFYAGSRMEFLRSSFLQPVSIERVKALVQRSATDIKGITDAMEAQITRTLADGLIRGDHPRVVAKLLVERVDKIGVTRAYTLARTEIIRAHAEGQLDAFERMGVKEIGVMVEWRTARQGVCPMCRPMQGVVLTPQKARGMIPRHANCRCSFIPTVISDGATGQKHTPVQIARAVRASIKANPDEPWVGKRLSKS